LSSGLPITKPPYGRVTAIDLNTGDHRWVIPLGAGPREHPLLRGLKLSALGWPSRGFVTVTRGLLLVTQEPALSVRLSANGRVFELTATTREPKLSVLAKDSGQLLGAIDLPANAGGSQMTYRVGNRQFIVIPVGGGGVTPELIALSTPESADSK
jgi:quinoprotein glucose dehydrogenase